MHDQVLEAFDRMTFEILPQQFAREIRNRRHILQIHSDVFAFRNFHRLCHNTALAEATRTYQDKVICAFHKLTDVGNLLLSIREIIVFHDGSNRERILHVSLFQKIAYEAIASKGAGGSPPSAGHVRAITIFFVTIFFVIG